MLETSSDSTRASLSPRQPALGAARPGRAHSARARRAGAVAARARTRGRRQPRRAAPALPRPPGAARRARAETGFARLGAELRSGGATARTSASSSAWRRPRRLRALRHARRGAAGADVREQARRAVVRAARSGRARVRGDARADRAGPGRGRAGTRASPSASASSCSPPIQGIAALHTAGIVAAEQLDELLADAIAHFLRGSRVSRLRAAQPWPSTRSRRLSTP